MLKRVILLSLIISSITYARQIVIAIGGSKGNYFKVGKDINKKVYSGKAKIINTQGSVENMLLVASGKADIALVQADALAMLETFYKSEGKTKDDLVEIIGTLYQETVHILVTDKSDIYATEDLDSKTIVSGGKGSGTTLTASLLAQEYGIEFGYNRNCSATKGIKLLKRQKIDALFYVTKAPSARLQKYKTFRMIETVDEDNRNEYLKSITLSKESYKFLNYDTRTCAVDTIIIVKKDQEKHLE
jgi:TRAP transporter TAXI family solute receptor